MTGTTIGYAQFAGSRGRGGGGQGGYSNMGGAIPGRTQDWSGGRTPLAVSGGRTPAWGAASGGRSKSFPPPRIFINEIHLTFNSTSIFWPFLIRQNPHVAQPGPLWRPHTSLRHRRRQPHSKPLRRRQPHRQSLWRSRRRRHSLRR